MRLASRKKLLNGDIYTRQRRLARTSAMRTFIVSTKEALSMCFTRLQLFYFGVEPHFTDHSCGSRVAYSIEPGTYGCDRSKLEEFQLSGLYFVACRVLTLWQERNFRIFNNREMTSADELALSFCREMLLTKF